MRAAAKPWRRQYETAPLSAWVTNAADSAAARALTRATSFAATPRLRKAGSTARNDTSTTSQRVAASLDHVRRNTKPPATRPVPRSAATRLRDCGSLSTLETCQAGMFGSAAQITAWSRSPPSSRARTST